MSTRRAEIERELRQALKAVARGDNTGLLACTGTLLIWLRHDQSEWARDAAMQVAMRLAAIERDWRAGEIRHVDEGLGWKRPRKWDQAAARRRHRLQWTVYNDVGRALERGAITPDVFEDVADLRRKEERRLSPSQVQKWFYEMEAIHGRYPTAARARSQKSLRNIDKKKTRS